MAIADHKSPDRPLPLNARSRRNELECIPFAQLLMELQRSRESGTLLVHGFGEFADTRVAVRVRVGEPVAALAETSSAHSLFDLLVELCRLAQGRFEFVEEHDLVGERGLSADAPLSPLPIIAASMRVDAEAPPLSRALHSVGQNQVLLKPRVDVSPYGFTSAELRVVAALEPGPADLATLAQRAQVSEAVVASVVGTLWATRAAGLLPAVRNQTSGAFRLGPEEMRSRVPPARPLSEPSVQRRRARAVRPHSAVSALQRQRTSQSSGMHARPTPSRPVSSPTSGPVRRVAARAESAPASPPARGSSLPPVGDEQARNKLNRAKWENIELMAQRRRYGEALSVAHEALKSGEALPEHQALLAYIIYQHSGGGSRAHERVWMLFDRALRRDPLCEKALYYKALVLKCTGQPDQAFLHLERLLLVNPKHIDAVREVRLYRMRRDQRRQQSSNRVRKLFSGKP